MSPAAVQIVHPGLLTTVQDGGRSEWESFGIPRGGARDMYAYIWANRLAANSPRAAVLEVTLSGPTIEVSESMWIATAGAREIEVDGRELPSWAGFWVEAGSHLFVGQTVGARAYIAIHGGIAVDPVLGSRSTDLESRFGGYQGRALVAGDMLPVGASSAPAYSSSEMLRHPAPPRLDRRPLEVRVVAGPRSDDFAPEAYATLTGSVYRVSSRSNHMGLRLEGAGIPTESRGTRISEPMPIGGVQVTPGGQSVVLLNARGTIGGYPLIATVCSTDVWMLGQARPGDELRLSLVSVPEAQMIRRAVYRELQDVQPMRVRGR